MRAWVLAGALALMAGNVKGDFYTGNQLYEACKADNGWACYGYIFGVADALLGTNGMVLPALQVCPPTGVNGRQVRDIVVNYLEDYPAQRNLAASFLVMVALQDVWRCSPR